MERRDARAVVIVVHLTKKYRLDKLAVSAIDISLVIRHLREFASLWTARKPAWTSSRTVPPQWPSQCLLAHSRVIINRNSRRQKIFGLARHVYLDTKEGLGGTRPHGTARRHILDAAIPRSFILRVYLSQQSPIRFVIGESFQQIVAEHPTAHHDRV